MKAERHLASLMALKAKLKADFVAAVQVQRIVDCEKCIKEFQKNSVSFIL